jgi:catechol 2,3-dioxygenase-like lactoylglutathione lyase family enzyme
VTIIWQPEADPAMRATRAAAEGGRCGQEALMAGGGERAMGIGGVFFRARDASALANWYRDHLGLPVEEFGGAILRWRAHDDPTREHLTVWSPFRADTSYFGPGGQGHMVNYIVADLDRMLAQLRAAGVTVLEQIEESDYGRFGWAVDPDGNRFELWQPPA